MDQLWIDIISNSFPIYHKILVTGNIYSFTDMSWLKVLKLFVSVPLSGHCYRYWHCSALVDPATLPQFWLCAAAAHLSIVLKQNTVGLVIINYRWCLHWNVALWKLYSLDFLLLDGGENRAATLMDFWRMRQSKRAIPHNCRWHCHWHWQVSIQEEREGQQWRSLEGKRAQIVGKWQMQSLSCRGWKARGCWSSNEAAVGGAPWEVGGKGEAGQCAQHQSRKKFAQLGL